VCTTLHDFENYQRSNLILNNNNNKRNNHYNKPEITEKEIVLQLSYNLKKIVDQSPNGTLLIVLFPFGNLHLLYSMFKNKAKMDQVSFQREFERLYREMCLGIALTAIKKEQKQNQ
jgi:hypothetical protein